MAGRAGRRGLDAVGTVVVAAWEEVPGEAELRALMTGEGGGFGRGAFRGRLSAVGPLGVGVWLPGAALEGGGASHSQPPILFYPHPSRPALTPARGAPS